MGAVRPRDGDHEHDALNINRWFHAVGSRMSTVFYFLTVGTRTAHGFLFALSQA
jgi:hypothetical protein